MTGIVQAWVALTGAVTAPGGAPSDELPAGGPMDPGLSGASEGMGWVGPLMLLVVVASVAVLVVKVVLARRMARDAGMREGRATAMTLLSGDGLDATYLAASLRPDPSDRSPTGTAARQRPAPVRSAEARLVELQSLLDRGLVTREEYAARRRAILDSV